MNMSNIISAHLKSLKILILQVLILPATIYRDTISKLSDDKDENETGFQVLHWVVKIYDALIVLSYSLGSIILLLWTTNIVEEENPIWYSSWEDGYYNENEEWISNSSYYFEVEGLIVVLVSIYFLPLAISLVKEIFSIAIMQVIRLGKIEKNTRK